MSGDDALLRAALEQAALLLPDRLGLPDRTLQAGNQHHLARPRHHRAGQRAALERRFGKTSHHVLVIRPAHLIQVFSVGRVGLLRVPHWSGLLFRPLRRLRGLLRASKTGGALPTQRRRVAAANLVKGLPEVFGNMVQRVAVGEKLRCPPPPGELAARVFLRNRRHGRLRLPAFYPSVLQDQPSPYFSSKPFQRQAHAARHVAELHRPQDKIRKMQVQPPYGILRGIVHQDDTAGAVAFLQRAGGQKARTAAETDIGDLYCPGAPVGTAPAAC